MYAGIQTLVALGRMSAEAAETACFLKDVNDVFDFLNVRSVKGDKVNKPLTAAHEDIDKLHAFRDKVSLWRTKDKQKQQPCFQALVQSLNATELILQDLVKNGAFTYLLTGRINQDCIENFFSQVRGRGGHRVNPSSREFKFAFRALSTNMFMTPVHGANCMNDKDELLISLSDLSRSSISQKKKDVDVDERVGKRTKVCNVMPNALVDVIEDFQLSSTVTNIVNYIGGYIVRKIKLGNKCPDCMSKLTSNRSIVEESDLLCHFKAHKHDTKSAFGSLIVPSPCLSRYLQRVESGFQKHIPKMLCATKLMATLVVTLQETIPFRILHLCKHHNSGDFAMSILRCYIRCRLHYYFKFETRALIQKKVKKTRKLQILKHK